MVKEAAEKAEKKGEMKGKKLGLKEGEEKGLKKGEKIGEKRGITKGEEIGIKKGKQLKAVEMAKLLLQKGIDPSIIAETSGLTIKEVEKLGGKQS